MRAARRRAIGLDAALGQNAPLLASAAGAGGLVATALVPPATLRPLPWAPGQTLPLPPLHAGACAGGGPLWPDPWPAVLLVDRRALTPEAVTATTAVLDPSERERAQRFRRTEDRDRHRLGRAVLRLVLGAWLDRDPAALRFRYGPHGKPLLEGCADGGPHFNLAHSGALILLAFHPCAPVGVDVERQRPDRDWRPIAARILPAWELEALEALAPALQPQGFLQAWCRLEAQLKASGEGLSGLDRLRRERAPQAGRPPAGPHHCWDVLVPTGYGAAVALASLA